MRLDDADRQHVRQPKAEVVKFKLHCGHTVKIPSHTSFFRVLREQPRNAQGVCCMRCYLEEKASR